MTRRETFAGGCGCGRHGDAGLVPVAEALARGRALAPPVEGRERATLRAAAGRIAAAAVTTATALPPFANAAMDGYALRGADVAAAGAAGLPIAFTLHAGDVTGALPPGHACRIMTGAMLPRGADCVLAQEDARLAAGRLHLAAAPPPGTHLRAAGSDLPRGAEILAAGTVIGARQAGLLAAAGVAEVDIRRRLRVALLTTGSELRAPGTPLGPGAIWNANRDLIAATIARPWVDLLDLGALPDDPRQLARCLAHAGEIADLVVTTGGVSVGEADHLVAALTAAGGTVALAGVAMKPGKPLALGRIGSATWIGLPGNPVAAFVTWQVIGQWIAAQRAGAAAGPPKPGLARLTAAVTQRPGRTGYRLARFAGHDGAGTPLLHCLDGDASHRLGLLAGAEALAVIPCDSDGLRAGDLVETLTL